MPKLRLTGGALLPQRAGIPGGTVPFRYGEARGIFSFEKRMSPQPPKEKRGGISISPRTPLKRHKGAKLRFLPFGNPSKDKGSGSGERSRKCPICTTINAAPTDAGTQLFEESASAQLVEGLWSCMAVRDGGPLVLGELAFCRPTHPQASFLLTMNGRFLFGKTKRKWGFNPVPHSGTSPHQFGA